MSDTSNTSVLSFGELLWDLLPSGKVLGGAPANFSFRLQSLGIPVMLVSKVGSDREGDEAIEYLQKNGIATDLIQRDSEYPTGTVDVSLDKNGIPSFTINKAVAYDHIDLDETLASKARNCSMLCYGSLIQRDEHSRQTLHEILNLAKSARKFLDINLRKDCYTRETIFQSLEYANIAKLNNEEAEILTQMFSLGTSSLKEFCKEMIARFGLESCLVTLGENGVFALSREEGEVSIPGKKVDVSDTIGSGDSFSAGFVSFLLKGRPFRECCDFGNSLGALVAGTKGGMANLSTTEISRFSGYQG